MQKQGLVALVFGSTGAIGAELIVYLLRSKQWDKVHCVVRRELEEWKTLPGSQKLVIQKFDDMDEYFKQKNDHYGHVNSVFCCLGTQVKVGEEMFRKIDQIYPLLAADIALNNKIPHYLLFSSTGGNETSCLLYLRVKGEVERDMKLKKLRVLSILKPGLLKNRRDARFGQKVAGILPCVASIEAIEAAEVLASVAERYAHNIPKNQNFVEVLQNEDMLDVIRNKRTK